MTYKKYNFYASNISVSKFNTLIPGLRDPKQGLFNYVDQRYSCLPNILCEVHNITYG